MPCACRQHLRFIDGGAAKKYQGRGIRGHNIDQTVYFVTAVGGSSLAWARNGLSAWVLITFPLVIAVIARVRYNEREVNRALGRPPKTIHELWSQLLQQLHLRSTNEQA